MVKKRGLLRVLVLGGIIVAWILSNSTCVMAAEFDVEQQLLENVSSSIGCMELNEEEEQIFDKSESEIFEQAEENDEMVESEYPLITEEAEEDKTDYIDSDMEVGELDYCNDDSTNENIDLVETYNEEIAAGSEQEADAEEGVFDTLVLCQDLVQIKMRGSAS